MEVEGLGAAIFIFAYHLCHTTTIVLYNYITSFEAAGKFSSLLPKQYAEITEEKFSLPKSELQTLHFLYTQGGATY